MKARRRAPFPPLPGPKPQPNWLLMVHMAADAPNLQEPLYMDFEELSRPLREVGEIHEGRIIVVAQVDTATGVSKRFRLTHEDPECITVFPTPEKESLKQFVEETIKRYPDPKWRAVIVWGHASGVGHGLEGPVRAGLDGSPALPLDRTSSKELKAAGVNVVGFDACFMASAELAYEMRKGAQYLIAPQAGIGLEGWHYDQFVDQILANPDIPPGKLCDKVIEQVGLSYSSPEQLSLLRLGDHVELLTDQIKTLAAAIKQQYEDPNREPQMRQWIFDCFNEAVWAGARQFLDLGDLCKHLASRIPERPVREAALGVLHVLSWNPDVFIPFPGLTRSRAVPPPDRGLVADQLSMLDIPLSGISIYSPWPRATVGEVRRGARNVLVDYKEYKKLEFVTATGWGELMFELSGALEHAERYWIRRESVERTNELVAHIESRMDDPKGAGKFDDPKSPKKMDDPKPAGRGDEVKRTIRAGGSRRTRRDGDGID